MSASSQTFKKVGDQDGFKENTVLTTDADKNLKLVPIDEIDYHSGVETIADGVSLIIRENKQAINFTMLTIDGDLTLDGDLWLA